MAVALAARVALRVLPIVWTGGDAPVAGGFHAAIVLPIFHIVSAAWTVAIYPDQATRHTSAITFTYAPNASSAGYAVYAAHAAYASTSEHPLAYIDASSAADFAAAAATAAWNAATAAATAAEAAAAATVWRQVSADATRFDEGVSFSDVSVAPLWPFFGIGGPVIPLRITELWQEMKNALLDRGEDWDVWTDWYEARLRGNPSIEELEIARATIPDETWKQGPAVVNAEIKRLINEHKRRAATKEEPKPAKLPEIPPLRPAALEPIWSDGKLTLTSGPASTDGDPDASMAALHALRGELVDLADDVEQEPRDFDKRIVPDLRRTASRIPGHIPPHAELFRIAHAKEWLQDYSNTVNEQWPDHLARRFHALMLLFDRSVRQFPKWREFVRNAEGARLTPEQAAAVPVFAREFVEAMRDEDARQFIDPAFPLALEDLHTPLQMERQRADDRLPQAMPSTNLRLAEDVAESINNTLKRAVEAALTEKCSAEAKADSVPSAENDVTSFGISAKKIASAYVREAEKSLIKEAERLGEGTGRALTKWVKRFVFGGGAMTAWMQLSPTAFQWLGAIKPFFGLH